MNKVKFRIPNYIAPRTKWRRLIHAEAVAVCAKNGVCYSETEKLEIEVILYLNDNQLESHDIDNRLKDVMDALQGRLGGSKAKKPHRPLIPNDRQVYRLVGVKKEPPKQSHGWGHVTIRKYKE